jgi:hypothetical protein
MASNVAAKEHQTKNMSTKNNTETLEPTASTRIRPRPRFPASRIRYRNLTRPARSYGVHMQVLLEQRVLADFQEFDPDLGEDTAGVILSLLAYDLLTKPAGDGRLTVCLLRRLDESPVEVDLMVLRRHRHNGEHIYLRLAGVRELAPNN